MTRPEDDADLREIFSRLRREETDRAPGFAEIRGTARGRRRGASPLRVVLLAAAGVLGLALLLRVGHQPSGPGPGSTAAALSITEWRSPTDFLLATPGREILRRVPELGRGFPMAPPEMDAGKPSPSQDKENSLMNRFTAALLVSLVAPAASAQSPQAGEDPIAQNLFPPELVMRHGGEIGLDERQRAAIKEAIQKAQSKFLDIQWELQAESEKVVRLLQAKPVDEAAVLAQVDKVLALEREVKRTQLSLLVRIKNLLTDAQQARLAELRRQTPK